MLLVLEVMSEDLLHFYLSIFPLSHDRYAIVRNANVIRNLSMLCEQRFCFCSKQFRRQYPHQSIVCH